MDYEGAAPMINAHSAHSEPEKQPGDLEHINEIAERALYPVIKLNLRFNSAGR